MGMNDTNDIKQQLEERLTVLGARVDELEEELRAPRSADWEERAIEMEGDEVQERLKSSALTEIRQIQAALKRIAAGSYGECESCGEPIGEKRLAALPYAVTCIKCASGG